MVGWWVLLGTLAGGLLLGLLARARNGRIRATQQARTAPTLPAPVRELLDPAAELTLVQLSSTFCAPCRQARAVYEQFAATASGVRHVELDVTERPELASQLGVHRTPTTIGFDQAGAEILRISGVPKLSDLRAARGGTSPVE
ncbi:thioredoxin [Tamaricihabitans halophyticus]|uniref:Thioredoxin n=1 Tax=Tamaricihabitans halophyticus TaxID=1262583 RepID=A0A4R2R490_9PSEU|nr:thioredoxin family protein [Tamaricihabitans halophyticus]TCP54361.1 thioredoxin [Tamaricihabitans halophyticus]